MSAKLFCAYLLLSIPLAAAEAWKLPLFTSDARAVLAAASGYPIPENVNAMTLDYSVSVQLEDSGKMSRTTRSVTRIQRVQAIAPASRVRVGWVTWRENRPKVRARVITPDGREHLLSETGIKEIAGPASDSGASPYLKILSATLPEVAADSVIELQIEESDREPAYPHGRSAEVTLNSPFPTAHFELDIASSSAAPLRAEPRSFPAGVKLTSQPAASPHSIKFEASNIFPQPDQSLLPPDVPSVPTVAFSNVPGWQDIAQWYAELAGKSSETQSAAHTQHSTDRLQAIEDALEEVRSKIHSTGVALGAAPYAPRNPAELLQTGSGDGKDQAALLIAKLAAIGIPAKVALIASGSRPDPLPTLPGIEVFNRALVYIPGDKPLWIDPAAEFSSAARLPVTDQRRAALIVDPSTTGLVRTPESAAADNRQLLSTEIRLFDGRDAVVKQTIEAQGAFEDLLRPIADAANGTDANRAETAKLQLARLAGTQRIVKVEAGEPHKLLAPSRVETEAEGYRASRFTDDGGFIDLPGPASVAFQRIAKALKIDSQSGDESAPTRKVDYYLPPAFTEESSYHLIPPAGYRVQQPPSVSLAVGPIAISATSKLDPDGTLWVKYLLVSPKTRYTPQDVAAMRRDSARLAALTALRVALVNVAEEKLAAGNLKEAVDLFREKTNAEPSNVNAALRLAGAYVAGGAREEAVKICRQILEKDPKHVPAWLRLGWAYAHDEFGRPFAPGMNIEESEKAYRKAIALGSRAALLQLATLYTYNAAGIRFGASARLSDATRLYNQAGVEALGTAGLTNDYAATLLFSRNYAELRRFFHYPQAEAVDPVLKFAAIAGASGPSSAREEAEFTLRDVAKQRTALLAAARYLENARDFESASKLVQLLGTGTPALSPFELSHLPKTRSFDESSASPQPSIAAFQRFIVAVLNPPDPEAWKKIAAPEIRDAQLPQLRLALLELFDVPEPVRQSVAAPALADMLATASGLTAEGSEAAGFRIRIPNPSNKTSAKTAGYIVKRPEGYLVVGLAGSALRTPEALLKAESGDLAAARQWLEWASDEIARPKPAGDPLAQPAFQRLWPVKSSPDQNLVTAAAASLAVFSSASEQAIKTLTRVREQLTAPELQAAADQALAQGLFFQRRYSEAVPVLTRVRARWPNSAIGASELAQSLILTGQFPAASAVIQELERLNPGSLEPMRLREHILVAQGNLKAAAALESEICKQPKATPFDWNDLAWIGLFAQANGPSLQQAARQAAALSQGRNLEILHTLALVQASTGQLGEARANAYELLNAGMQPDAPLVVFARIAEQLSLPDTAAAYYRRVQKPNADAPLSLYSFAQMRLTENLDPKPN